MIVKFGHKYYYIIIGLLILVGLASCKKSKDEVKLVDIAQKEYTVEQKGGRVDVSFVPLTDWSVSCSADFVSFEPSAGQASKEEVKVGVVVGENTSPYDRDFFVKFVFEYNQVDIKFTQKGLSDSPDKPDRPDVPDNPQKDTGETEDIEIGNPIDNQ